MTDVIALASRLFDRIEWQNTPDDVTKDDLAVMIADAIRYLYVVTGRALEFNESMFSKGEDTYTFAPALQLDEQEYVILTAEINFYTKVQTGVSDQVSYTTDAMSVSHGDKPFANLQQKLVDLEARRRIIWYKMIRFHLL